MGVVLSEAALLSIVTDLLIRAVHGSGCVGSPLSLALFKSDTRIIALLCVKVLFCVDIAQGIVIWFAAKREGGAESG